jgi:hypothetical protein
MKTYNRALDFMALAMQQHAKGRTKTAASLFIKASEAPDVKAAIAIIEASNAQAYTAKVKAEAAAKKPVVKAKSEATAAEQRLLASLIGDVDDEEFADDGEEVEAEAEPVGEPEKVEDEAVEDADDAEAFATALASLKKPPKAKK